MTESMVPAIYEPDLLDEKITVEDGEAFETTRLLAAHEGIFVGMSSGAAVAGALRIAREMTPRHDRRHPARPRRPLPEHDALSLDLRQVPTVEIRQAKSKFSGRKLHLEIRIGNGLAEPAVCCILGFRDVRILTRVNSDSDGSYPRHVR